jgi:hypothetical protein
MELQLFVSSSSQSASEEINQTGSAEIGPHVVVVVVVFYKKIQHALALPVHARSFQSPPYVLHVCMSFWQMERQIR